MNWAGTLRFNKLTVMLVLVFRRVFRACLHEMFYIYRYSHDFVFSVLGLMWHVEK